MLINRLTDGTYDYERGVGLVAFRLRLNDADENIRSIIRRGSDRNRVGNGADYPRLF